MKNSFNIQELLHCKSKRHGTKPIHSSSLKKFQRHQKHNLKHPCLMDFITFKKKTKQKKLPYFMDKHPGHEIDIFTLNGYPYKGHIINH
jgi:hypothetical protein